INQRSRIVRNIVRTLIHAQYPLVLLGDPGTGKSMTLREVAKEIATNGVRRVFPMLVVYLRLGDFRVEGDVTNDRILAFIGQRLSDNARRWLPELISAGRLVVLFDGMDEMSRLHYGEYVKALSRFASTYQGQIKSLFSCRINDFSPEFLQRQLV